MQTAFSSTKRSSSISINFIMPQGWHELADKQLRYVYQLLAADYATDEIKTLCLLQWSGIKVIGCKDTGSYLLKKVNNAFASVQHLRSVRRLWHRLEHASRQFRGYWPRE